MRSTVWDPCATNRAADRTRRPSSLGPQGKTRVPPVQVDLNRQIHAPLAAERTEDGDGLSRNAVSAGRNIARAPFAADDRGFRRRKGGHGAQYRRIKGEVFHNRGL